MNFGRCFCSRRGSALDAAAMLFGRSIKPYSLLCVGQLMSWPMAVIVSGVCFAYKYYSSVSKQTY